VDYYTVLSIARDAPTDEILKSWRRLILIYHPDKRKVQEQPLPADSPSGAHDIEEGGLTIRLINEAKWILSDPDRRKEWEDEFFSQSKGIYLYDTPPNYHRPSE
jgi:curved DNA-binding protein CbpA